MFYPSKLLAAVFVFACVQAFASNADIDDVTEGVANLNMSQVTLARPNQVRYTDILNFGQDNNGSYDLNSDFDKTLSTKVFGHSAGDSWKSHVYAEASVVYHDKQGETVVNHKPLTTGVFSAIGIGEPGTDHRIDWMSHESKFTDGFNVGKQIFCHRSNTGSGHSEPQMIRDISDLLLKDSDSVVALFAPQSLQDVGSVAMCGLELYGPFDACNSCLGDLVDFCQEHQAGQMSISEAIKAKLAHKKCTCTDTAKDRFVPIYHAKRPYKNASYQVTHNEAVHTLKAKCTYASIAFDAAEGLANTMLTPHETVGIEEGMIYTHIHGLSGKQAKFDASLGLYQF